MYALEVESLTQKYAEKVVLDNISLKVKENTVHGFLGPNGAGKTTTLKSICGIIPIFNGQVKFYGEKVNYEKSDYKKSFGALIEEPTLYEDMRVYEFLEFICKLYRIPKKQIKSAVEVSLNKILINSISNRLIKNLSKGYKQRVAIAATIVHNPKIIILDEPTVGLDVSAIAQMREVILNLKKDHTVLISSHILHEMELICDEVTLINNSKIIATKDLSQVENNNTIVTLKNTNKSVEEIRNLLNEVGIDTLDISQDGFNLEQFFFTSIRSKDDK